MHVSGLLAFCILFEADGLLNVTVFMLFFCALHYIFRHIRSFMCDVYVNDFCQEIEPLHATPCNFMQHQLSLPVVCAFAAERDMYAAQEQNKYSENSGKWTCGFCGKSFYDEKFLDKHFDARHRDKVITV